MYGALNIVNLGVSSLMSLMSYVFILFEQKNLEKNHQKLQSS
jgi:hypothetical protein